MNLYIIDPNNFKGSVLNSMPFAEPHELDGQFVHYKDGVTFAEYNKQHGGNLQALTLEDVWQMIDDFNQKTFCTPFEEITEDRYFELLECLPPSKWHDLNDRFNSFYICEALTGDIHCFCIKDNKTGKYYSSNRSRFISDAKLLSELKAQIN